MTQIQERMKLVQQVGALISEKHVNPIDWNYDYARWRESLHESAKAFCAGSNEDFERGIDAALRELRTSHLGLIRKQNPGVPATFALNAGLMPVQTAASRRWMFRDVVEDGPAHQGGIQAGEILLAIDGTAVEPGNVDISRPEDRPSGEHQADRTVLGKIPLFRLGKATTLTIGRLGDDTGREVTVNLPGSVAKDRPPLIEPKAVSYRTLDSEIGYLRIAYFPGAIGYSFIEKLNAAIRALQSKGSRRFVLDLRGNPGGGLGSHRLMSLLAARALPIGYSLTRLAIRKGWTKEDLPRIDRIPTQKLEKLALVVRFKILHRDRSIALKTETVSPSALAGSTVLLVNDATKSAAEMIAAFSKEHRLAPIIGSHTPGEVLGAVNFKLSKEYSLRMPTATWHTWGDLKIEGVGISPDIAVDLDPARLAQGRDVQLEAAVERARRL